MDYTGRSSQRISCAVGCHMLELTALVKCGSLIYSTYSRTPSTLPLPLFTKVDWYLAFLIFNRQFAAYAEYGGGDREGRESKDTKEGGAGIEASIREKATW